MVEITLEQMVDGAKEATVHHWHREEGDYFEEGDDLVELIVDGTAVKITAPCSGVLNEVFFTEGDTFSGSDVLCEIEDEYGEEDEDEKEDEASDKTEESDDDDDDEEEDEDEEKEKEKEE